MLFLLTMINIRTIKWRYIIAVRSWSHKEYSCFYFLAHLMLTYNVFWGSLGTSFFRNSSSAANKYLIHTTFETNFAFLMTLLVLTNLVLHIEFWCFKEQNRCFRKIYVELNPFMHNVKKMTKRTVKLWKIFKVRLAIFE